MCNKGGAAPHVTDGDTVGGTPYGDLAEQMRATGGMATHVGGATALQEAKQERSSAGRKIKSPGQHSG